MVKWLKLDKVFVQGTTYTMPPDMFYVIKKIGCDQDTATKLVIDGVETGAIIQKLANMYPTSTNELGPLDLKNLFYVVPPDKKFYVSGASGAKMRCVGLILVLEGEILDILTTTPGKKGLDAYFMPRPPKYDGVNVPFSFEDLPIEVPGDYTLTMKLINNSGGDLTVAAATDQYIDYIVEYQKIK